MQAKAIMIAGFVLAGSALPALAITAIANGRTFERPLLENDTQVLGVLFLTLMLIFHTDSSDNKCLKTFYNIVPSLLLCYFVPSLLGTVRCPPTPPHARRTTEQG